MTEKYTSTYNGKPCRSTEMTIRNTLFTVISVQGDTARETAYDKIKKLILDNLDAASKSYQSVHS
ncbi:MAG: hypothetical protein IJC97_00305 [Oscillospiraceae bacterium]|nr:hypothetical protein [Oscillospiraceae bacterium]